MGDVCPVTHAGQGGRSRVAGPVPARRAGLVAVSARSGVDYRILRLFVRGDSGRTAVAATGQSAGFAAGTGLPSLEAGSRSDRFGTWGACGRVVRGVVGALGFALDGCGSDPRRPEQRLARFCDCRGGLGIPAVHFGLDIDAQGRDADAWESAIQFGVDTSRFRDGREQHGRLLAAAISRHGVNRRGDSAPFLWRYVHLAGSGGVLTASAALVRDDFGTTSDDQRRAGFRLRRMRSKDR
jgi:hypothetical protein